MCEIHTQTDRDNRKTKRLFDWQDLTTDAAYDQIQDKLCENSEQLIVKLSRVTHSPHPPDSDNWEGPITYTNLERKHINTYTQKIEPMYAR